MSSVHDKERKTSIYGNSPLRSHSMSQYALGITRQGQERLDIPRKVRMAERRRDRLAQEYSDWCDARRDRIFDRVLRCLDKQAAFGYDGIIPEILDVELSYLERTDPLNRH